jgi:hypothetical protein
MKTKEDETISAYGRTNQASKYYECVTAQHYTSTLPVAPRDAHGLTRKTK